MMFLHSELTDWVNKLRRKGILYKTRHDKIFMPLVIFQQMLSIDTSMVSFHQHLNPTYENRH